MNMQVAKNSVITLDYHVTDDDRLWGNVTRRVHFWLWHERNSAGER